MIGVGRHSLSFSPHFIYSVSFLVTLLVFSCRLVMIFLYLTILLARGHVEDYLDDK